MKFMAWGEENCETAMKRRGRERDKGGRERKELTLGAF